MSKESNAAPSMFRDSEWTRCSCNDALGISCYREIVNFQQSFSDKEPSLARANGKNEEGVGRGLQLSNKASEGITGQGSKNGAGCSLQLSASRANAEDDEGIGSMSKPSLTTDIGNQAGATGQTTNLSVCSANGEAKAQSSSVSSIVGLNNSLPSGAHGSVLPSATVESSSSFMTSTSHSTIHSTIFPLTTSAPGVSSLTPASTASSERAGPMMSSSTHLPPNHSSKLSSSLLQSSSGSGTSTAEAHLVGSHSGDNVDKTKFAACSSFAGPGEPEVKKNNCNEHADMKGEPAALYHVAQIKKDTELFSSLSKEFREGFQICAIFEVQNSFLFTQYSARREALKVLRKDVNERVAYHMSKGSVHDICQNVRKKKLQLNYT